MLQFYKPTKTVKGTACSFWRNSDDNSFWASMIKQDSWNSKTNTGSFSKNKNDPQKRVIIKFSATEMAGFIDTIERNVEYSGYHGSQKQIVKFKFCPYIRDDKQIGFSLAVNREAKEDSTDKQSYIIGFNFPEARLLRCYLESLLKDSFASKAEKQSAAFKQAAEKQAADKKDGALSNQEKDDIDF
jgi:hypothetical protein